MEQTRKFISNQERNDWWHPLAVHQEVVHFKFLIFWTLQVSNYVEMVRVGFAQEVIGYMKESGHNAAVDFS